MRHAVTRLISAMGLAAALCVVTAVAAAVARDFEMGGDNQFPYSIMKPEPGIVPHRRATVAAPVPKHHPALLGHEKFVGKLHRPRGVFTSRGSSGSVLPTPLPRTPLIPPEGSGSLTLPPVSQEQGPSIVPGVTNPVPNLPRGPETFQDRASRCAFQSGLYNVPGTARTQYMGYCLQ